MDRKDDKLHNRFIKEPLRVYVEKDGALTDEIFKDGLTVDLEPMLDEYYRERGWTNNGIPTGEKLRELGLDDLVEDIP